MTTPVRQQQHAWYNQTVRYVRNVLCCSVVVHSFSHCASPAFTFVCFTAISLCLPSVWCYRPPRRTPLWKGESLPLSMSGFFFPKKCRAPSKGRVFGLWENAGATRPVEDAEWPRSFLLPGNRATNHLLWRPYPILVVSLYSTWF